MRYLVAPAFLRLALCLMFGSASASAALAQGSQEPAADRGTEPWQAAPQALPPATTSEAEPLGRLLPSGETLPRAELDANPYRQPAYEHAPLSLESVRAVSTPDGASEAANESTLPAAGRAEQASFDSAPRPLQRPGEAKRLPKPDSVATDGRPASGLPSMLTVFGSLLVVLAAFFAITWFMRRGMPNRLAALPTEVVEVLGRSTLATRNQMHLIRVGNKLLLVSVTPTGAETLTEITDPAEVDRLGAICSQQQTSGIAQSFRGVLDQLNRDAESGDPLETGDRAAPSRRGLFARRPLKDTNHDA